MEIWAKFWFFFSMDYGLQCGDPGGFWHATVVPVGFGFGLFMELWLGFNELWRLGVMAKFDERDEWFLAGDKVIVGFIRK